MKRDTSTLTEKQASELRGELRSAIAAHTKAAIRVARGLFEVKWATTRDKGSDVPLAVAWGFDDFEDYCEHELGIHGGTANLYALVYDELCVRRSFDDGILPDSITKLKVLARVSRHVKDGRVLQGWIARSRELGCCDLEDAVETELFGGRGRKRTLSFYMKWSRVAPLLKRIHEARTQYGVGTNGEALTEIVNDWAARHEEGASKKQRAG